MHTQVGTAAAAVAVPSFTPQQGVRIETDPKAAAQAPGPTSGDDDSVIADLATQLKVWILLPRCNVGA